MSEQIEQSETVEDNSGAKPLTYTTPRWVKLLGIAAIILFLLLIAIMMVTGGHNPSRHFPSAEAATATEHGEHSQ